jgi:hypothetical protein
MEVRSTKGYQFSLENSLYRLLNEQQFQIMWPYAQSELENQTQVLPICSDVSLILIHHNKKEIFGLDKFLGAILNHYNMICHFNQVFTNLILICNY